MVLIIFAALAVGLFIFLQSRKVSVKFSFLGAAATFIALASLAHMIDEQMKDLPQSTQEVVQAPVVTSEPIVTTSDIPASVEPTAPVVENSTSYKPMSFQAADVGYIIDNAGQKYSYTESEAGDMGYMYKLKLLAPASGTIRVYTAKADIYSPVTFLKFEIGDWKVQANMDILGAFIADNNIFTDNKSVLHLAQEAIASKNDYSKKFINNGNSVEIATYKGIASSISFKLRKL